MIVRPSPIIEGVILLALSPPSRSPIFVTLSPASGFFVNKMGNSRSHPADAGAKELPRRSARRGKRPSPSETRLNLLNTQPWADIQPRCRRHC